MITVAVIAGCFGCGALFLGRAIAPDTSGQAPPATAEVEPTFIEAGVSQRFDDWAIVAGGTDVVFTRHLGSERYGKDSDEGYVFVLIPIAVTNDSKATASFGYARWTVTDDLEYTYTVDSGSDSYLDDDAVFNGSDIPPGATRRGTLIFQVSGESKNLYLTYGSTGLPWHFSVSLGG